MKPLKIAVWHNLPSGGGKRALYNHIRSLKSRGHYLEAWTTDFSSMDYLPLSQLITEHRKPVADGLETIGKIASPLNRVRATIKIMKEHSLSCLDEISKGGFDILFANSCALTTVPFLGLFTNLPSALYLGEPDRNLSESYNGRNIWSLPDYGFSIKALNRYRKDFFRNYSNRLMLNEQIEASRAFSTILVNSEFSRESVKRSYGINSRVCYPGVDEELFAYNEPVGKESYVVGMGRISAAKNPEMAILALSLIPEQKRPLLKWISNNPVYDHLEKTIILAVEKNVKFIPLTNINDQEITETLSHAAVMICTSHLEPFGLAPLEANMCGTSVIAVSEGGYRETIKNSENGFLVQGNDLEGIARLTEKFCSDLKYSEEMGKKARAYAIEHWNYSTMSENIENALIEVAG